MRGVPTHRIAVIPGDGIGKEVVPVGLAAARRALERVAREGPRAADLGGRATTSEVAAAIVGAITDRA